MRCQTCDYPLWNLTTRQCPECGEAFLPSDADFVPNSVRFCCPHCDQAYYGIGPAGHLEPDAFTCVQCGNAVTMNQMVLRPAEGVTERETRVDGMPWLESEGTGRLKGWFKTIGMAMTAPQNLMRGVPDGTSVVQAWVFAALTLGAFLFLGIGVPFALIGLISIMTGDPTGSGFIAAGAGMAVGALVAILVFTVIWGLTIHAILAMSGGCARGIGRTYEALCYSCGTNAICAIPCLGPNCSFIGGIWWIVSAVFMVMTGQRVSGGRASVAVIALPLFTFILGIVAYAGFTVWAVPQASMGMAPMTARGETVPMVTAMMTWAHDTSHDFVDAPGPDHGLQLFEGNHLTAWQFVMDGSSTIEAEIPVGDTNLDELQRMGPNRIAELVDAEVEALPDDVLAHRVGDFVFTSHGIDLTAPADPALWIIVLNPDPDVAGNADMAYFVAVGRADGAVETFGDEEMSTKLAAQNLVRAAHDLPPLPDPSTVRHGAPRPAVNSGGPAVRQQEGRAVHLRPILGLLALVCFIGGIGCLIGEAFFGAWTATALESLGSACLVLGGHAVVAIGLNTAYERGKLPKLMAGGIGLLLIAPVLWIVMLWGTRTVTERLAPFAVLASAWSVLIMIIGVALCQPATRRPARVVRGFTVTAAAVLMAGLPIAMFVALYLGIGRSVLTRAVTAGAVLVISGLFGGLIMGRVRELAEVPHAERPTIDLACPRCGKRQTIVIDGDRCGRCGLGITVQVP